MKHGRGGDRAAGGADQCAGANEPIRKDAAERGGDLEVAQDLLNGAHGVLRGLGRALHGVDARAIGLDRFFGDHQIVRRHNARSETSRCRPPGSRLRRERRMSEQ